MATGEEDLTRWLPAAKAGSSEALGRLLEAYHGYLLVIAQKELSPDLQAKGGASDLVQETFLDAHRCFNQFQGSEAGEVQAWLRRLLLNNLGNFTRRYRATAKRAASAEVAIQNSASSSNWAGQLSTGEPTPSAQAVANERAERLFKALGRLPEDYRQVILLRNQEGLAFAEIARTMGRSENAVEKLWARALDKLQHELDTLS